MKKRFLTTMFFVTLLAILAACGPTPTPAPVVQPTTQAEPTLPPQPVTLVLWTKEGEVDGGLQYVQALCDAYTVLHPNVTFEVVNKEVEALREDFQNASLAGSPPDLLWTVSDHAGPFVTADLIMPVDGLVDLSLYVESVEMGGKTWAVPISSGNHLMLIYNKDLIATPPADTAALLALAGTFPSDVYPLVFNQTEPFWMVPWLGGFGGQVFAEDGTTPTLNTPEMIATLKFMAELKTSGIIPPESDYDGADTLFKEGKAAMIVNGDWSLGGYKEALGDKLGVARLPMVVGGTYPAPYTSGVYFMLPRDLPADKLAVIKDFMVFATNMDNQVAMINTLSRLPGLKAATNDPAITSDPILKGSADQMVVGTPMPTVLEMRCSWDSMKPEMQAVLAGTQSAEDAARVMQESAELCILRGE